MSFKTPVISYLTAGNVSGLRIRESSYQLHFTLLVLKVLSAEYYASARPVQKVCKIIFYLPVISQNKKCIMFKNFGILQNLLIWNDGIK